MNGATELIGKECHIVFDRASRDEIFNDSSFVKVEDVDMPLIIEDVDMPLIKIRDPHGFGFIWVSTSIIKTIRIA